jgi:hypothetical protein
MDIPGTGMAGTQPFLQKIMGGIDSSQAQSAQTDEQIKASQQREQAARATQAAALGPNIARQKAALGNVPQMGEMKPAPEAPKAPKMDEKAMHETISVITALAAMGGALTRHPLTAALNNFAAGVDGLQKGQQDAFQKNLKEFDANLKKSNAENEAISKKYAAASKKYSNDIQALQNEYKLIAAETQSPIDLELAKRGDLVSHETLRLKRDQMYSKVMTDWSKFMTAHEDKMQAHQDRQAALGERTRHDKALEGEADKRIAKPAAPGKTGKGGAATPMPKEKSALVKGTVYQTARGAATWDGEKFVAQ